MSTEEYGLVMPFVVCRSKGGPYDDDSFCAGYAAGQLWAEFAGSPVAPESRAVRVDLLPQIDLVAMHFGYRIAVDPHDEEWSTVDFLPNETR